MCGTFWMMYEKIQKQVLEEIKRELTNDNKENGKKFLMMCSRQFQTRHTLSKSQIISLSSRKHSSPCLLTSVSS